MPENQNNRDQDINAIERQALNKILDQAYYEPDVSLDRKLAALQVHRSSQLITNYNKCRSYYHKRSNQLDKNP